MTAARHLAPSRSNPVLLPVFDAWLGRKPVLDKAKIAAWFEHPPHLPQRADPESNKGSRSSRLDQWRRPRAGSRLLNPKEAQQVPLMLRHDGAQLPAIWMKDRFRRLPRPVCTRPRAAATTVRRYFVRFLSHDQIENGREYPVLIKIHR